MASPSPSWTNAAPSPPSSNSMSSFVPSSSSSSASSSAPSRSHGHVMNDPPLIPRSLALLSHTWTRLLDHSTPHIWPRWSLFVGMLLLYALRVYSLQGFYIVTYGLGIFLLNMLIGFLSPLDEDALTENGTGGGGSDGPLLPLNDADDEFKPFMRRLPEFKFWYACTKAVVIALVLTLFPFFDVPVFWPILLIYFCVLFFLTMKRQIRHMIKHKYLPFNWGKKKYKGGTVKRQAEDIRSK